MATMVNDFARPSRRPILSPLSLPPLPLPPLPFLLPLLLLVVGLLLSPGLAHAKITNVQALAGKPVKEGLSGRVNVAGNFRAGNVQLAVASAGTTLYHRIGDHVILLNAKGAYGLKGSPGKWGDEPFRERLFEHVRYRLTLSKTWSTEGFVQHEYDRWRRLKLRALAGAGVRFDHKASDRGHVAVGLAYMAQWEELLDARAGDRRGLYLEHRLSGYLTGSVKMGDRGALTLTCYVQPKVQQFSDVRGLAETTLTFSLTDRLGLKLTGWWAWDTAPPSTVRGYDVNSTVGFTFAI